MTSTYDNQCQTAHSLDNLCLFERHRLRVGCNDQVDPNFYDGNDIPREISVVSRLSIIGKRNTQIDGRGNDKGSDHYDHGCTHCAMPPDKDQSRRVLAGENHAIHSQHNGKLLQRSPSIVL